MVISVDFFSGVGASATILIQTLKQPRERYKNGQTFFETSYVIGINRKAPSARQLKLRNILRLSLCNHEKVNQITL